MYLKKSLYLIMLGMFLVIISGCGLFVRHIPSGKVPSPTVIDHFVKIGAINYHYIEYPATGPDIFLLHGFASSTYTWEKMTPYLQKGGFHVWALDMKGFGWSDKPEGAKYDRHTLMEEVNAWMDRMGLRDVVFVGNSLGGGIAIMMAIDHPDKVGRMVLIDPGIYPHKQPFVMRLAHLPGSRFFSKMIFGRWMVRSNLREVFYHRDWVTEEQIDAYYDRLRSEGSVDAQTSLASSIRLSENSRYVKRIPTINVPSLIIWGKEDKWIPVKNGYRLRKELKNSTLVVIPECGHIAQEEKPELTAKYILDFVEGMPIKETPLPGAGN